MTWQNQSEMPRQSEISLVDIVRVVWWGKWITLVTALISMAGAAVAIHYITPLYLAQMTVSLNVQGAGVSGLRGIPGVESFVGQLDVSSRASTPFDELQAVLYSVELAEHLDEKHDLMAELFGSRPNTDPHEQKLKIPKSEGNVLKSFLNRVLDVRNRVLNVPEPVPPDHRNLSFLFADAMKVGYGETPSLRTITFEHSDPDFALRMLKTIFRGADELVRSRRKERLDAQVAYLRRKLAQEEIRDLRVVLIQLWSDREKQLMLLQGDLPYTVNVVKKPVVTAYPIYPPVGLFMWLSLGAGVLLGMIGTFVIHALRTAGRDIAGANASRDRELVSP